jgi:hypothetical protein
MARSASTIPCLLTILLAASPALAGEAVHVNGFKPLPAAATPLPGEAASLDAADDLRNANLPPPCTGRNRTGATVGTYAGAAAGIASGVAIRNRGDTLDKLAAAVIGMAVGGTVGYVAGRAYDGAYDGGLECEDPANTYAKHQPKALPPATELAVEKNQRDLVIHPVVANP